MRRPVVDSRCSPASSSSPPAPAPRPPSPPPRHQRGRHARASRTSRRPRRTRYVALGDSYTAGAPVPTTDLADGCFRSDGNYPSLLAAVARPPLTDVSVRERPRRDLIRRHHTVPDTPACHPSSTPSTRDTDLVTLGIGGNDLRPVLAAGAVVPGPAPDRPARLALCRLHRSVAGCSASAPVIGDHVQRAIEPCRGGPPTPGRARRLPPRIAPPDGGCPKLLPFARGDVAFGDRVLRALDASLREAAAATGVDYLDAYSASEGHDVCSDEPWVNGRRTQVGVALAFHPLEAGMQAMAAELEALLAAP